LPDWLLERGIGETRHVRIDDGEIVEAMIMLDGAIRAGSVIEGRLRSARVPALVEAEGREYLLPAGAPGVTEGAALRIEIVREAIPGAEPWKRPLARVTEEPSRDAVPLDAEVLAFPGRGDRLDDAGWLDLIEEARSGVVRFVGGELRVSVTPAMTLIDVDGTLSPLELALASARTAASAILRHGVGGSIGIDFPTIAGKAERQRIAAVVDKVLPQPFERTAINGFGFLQIVRPRRHASLFELAADRAAFEARALLRQSARESGAITLVAHPALIGVLEGQPDWLEQFSRQVGGRAGLRGDPRLTMSGGHAEKASHQR
jgi:ribonuclease G